jgi:hypothetical protein
MMEEQTLENQRASLGCVLRGKERGERAERREREEECFFFFLF